MEVKVLDFNGKDTGRKVQLSDSVFAIEPNNHAVYLDVKQYLLIKDKERTKQKKELKLREVHVRLRNKKELVLLVRVVQRIHCLKVEEQFSDLDQEVIHSN